MSKKINLPLSRFVFSHFQLKKRRAWLITFTGFSFVISSSKFLMAKATAHGPVSGNKMLESRYAFRFLVYFFLEQYFFFSF